MDIKKLKRLNMKKLANQLDTDGTDLMLRILKHMDSDNIYYTSIIAKALKYTWANTSKTLKDLTELGLIKSTQYIEKYNKHYFNITGLVLTKKGTFVKVNVITREK